MAATRKNRVVGKNYSRSQGDLIGWDIDESATEEARPLLLSIDVDGNEEGTEMRESHTSDPFIDYSADQKAYQSAYEAFKNYITEVKNTIETKKNDSINYEHNKLILSAAKATLAAINTENTKLEIKLGKNPSPAALSASSAKVAEHSDNLQTAHNFTKLCIDRSVTVEDINWHEHRAQFQSSPIKKAMGFLTGVGMITLGIGLMLGSGLLAFVSKGVLAPISIMGVKLGASMMTVGVAAATSAVGTLTLTAGMGLFKQAIKPTISDRMIEQAEVARLPSISCR